MRTFLLAADTRATYVNLSNRRVGCCDTEEKIRKTDVGIMAGRGSLGLLDLVNARLNQIKEIISTDELLRIIDEERLRCGRLLPQISEQSIQSTAWIFSYVTFAEGTFDKGTPTLRLGVIRSSGNIIGRHHLVDNYPCVLPPPEATENDAKFITDFLKTSIKPYAQSETLRNSIEYHWSLIAGLIRGIEPKFASISSHCQIGVCTVDGYSGISRILKDTDSSTSITLTPPLGT